MITFWISATILLLTVSFSAIYCWILWSESIQCIVLWALAWCNLSGISLGMTWSLSAQKIRIFHLSSWIFEKASLPPQLLCCRIAWLNSGQKGSSYALGLYTPGTNKESFFILSLAQAIIAVYAPILVHKSIVGVFRESSLAIISTCSVRDFNVDHKRFHELSPCHKWSNATLVIPCFAKSRRNLWNRLRLLPSPHQWIISMSICESSPMISAIIDSPLYWIVDSFICIVK